MRQVKVRYGRANLTIARWGAVALTPIGEVLARWREEEATDEDVAWAFVRHRVIAHTPSFDWGTADLDKLVALVTSVSREPKIKAHTTAELAPELDPIEVEDRKRWKIANERFRKTLEAVTFKFPKMDLDLKPFATQTRLAERALEGMSNQINLTRDIQARMEGWKGLTAAAGFKLQPGVLDTLDKLTQVPVFQEAIGIQTRAIQEMIGQRDWSGVIGQFTEAARAAQEPEIAEAVEGVAEVVTDPDALTLDEIAERFQPHFDHLAKLIQEAKDSPTKTALITFGYGLLLLLLQAVLARLGVPLP